MKRITKYVGAALLGLMTATSCSDFFEVDSDHVIFDNKEHLNNATDTIYSMIGVLNKLQAIGDRTILLGELRGDLIDVNEKTASDLRDVAMFNVGDDNMYNSPRDYYAIINNCNYYIAHADSAVKNNRNEYLFRQEFAAIKAIRAWTYLQLVTTYGRVPLVTEPILTKEQAEQDYPMYDIQGICNYFINEDGLDALVNEEYPNYFDIKGLPSRIFFIPMRLVLGDLNLWAGNYLDAAKYYYGYITHRNGENSSYPIGKARIYWMKSDWSTWMDSNWSYQFSNESLADNTEIITLIPGDSIPSEGYYSQLRNIFNSTEENDYEASVNPSQAIKDLSAAQVFCHYQDGDFMYAPQNLEENCSGDLRLMRAWYTTSTTNYGEQITYQYFRKYVTRNIRIYRRTLVYLRLAEAMNRAGYPRFAYMILAEGASNENIESYVLPNLNEADSAIVAQFDFPNSKYRSWVPYDEGATSYSMGIHSRGCGYCPANEYYQMPFNFEITDSLEQVAWQQDQVEKLIVDEEALEFAFEGYRFYDLMRVALRRNDPAFLADRIYARRGEDKVDEMKALIPVDLYNQKNWFLHWNNEIGY